MQCHYSLLFGAVDKQPLAESLLELLLARLASAATKDKLRPELPLKRDAPVLSSLLVDDGVVVLQVGAEALSLERNPEGVLVHGVGVLGPVAEVVCVEGEGLAEILDGLGSFIEEDLSTTLVSWRCYNLSSALETVAKACDRWWGLHHACRWGSLELFRGAWSSPTSCITPHHDGAHCRSRRASC
jgi:hypothetical protein